MDRLRILHAVFTSRLAGSERYCTDLANRQVAHGYEVHLAGVRGAAVATALHPQVRFHEIGTPFFRGWQLARIVRQQGIDVCHAHLSAACKAASSLVDQCATIATLHVGYKPHQHERLDALICVNRAQADRTTGFRGFVRTIPNWVPKAAEGCPTVDIRASLGVSKHTFLIGAVGRLHPSKGMDVLIQAFRAAGLKDAALVIFGEGDQRAELVRLAEGAPNIYLPGHRSDVQACLGSLDLFVSPSREESFGLAIVEAMSAGLPIISTAAEGPAEFLRTQPVTLLPVGSIAAMTDAISRAGGQFGAGALPRVSYDLSGFDPSERLASIGELYAQVLAARQSRGLKRQPAVAVAA